MKELKKCPFCGGEAEIVEDKTIYHLLDVKGYVAEHIFTRVLK